MSKEDRANIQSKLRVARFAAGASLDRLVYATGLGSEAAANLPPNSNVVDIFTSLWNHCAGVSSLQSRRSNAHLASAILWNLTSFYDDLTDESELIVPKADLKFSSDHRKGKTPFMLVSAFVHAVCDSNLPRDEKKALFSEVNRFRDEQYRMYVDYCQLTDYGSVGFGQVLEYRIKTSVPVVRIWSRALGTLNGLDNQYASRIDGLFADFGMALQFVDDFDDFLDDRDKTYNLLQGALNENPEEKQGLGSLLGEEGFTKDFAIANIPQSYETFYDGYKQFYDALANEAAGRERILVDIVDAKFGL